MEMQHVRYFNALCEERSFTRAARRCGVTQPSITKAIKALEAELGTRLFRRRRSGAELTGAGIAVAPYFAAIERCVEEIGRVPHRALPPDREVARDIVGKPVLPSH